MAIIVQLIINIFSYFASFAVAKLGARYGIRLALLAVFMAAFVTLTATVNAILGGLTLALPPLAQTAVGILPASTGACIAAIAATHAACWLYWRVVITASVKARV
jgi:hypothetical protein